LNLTNIEVWARRISLIESKNITDAQFHELINQGYIELSVQYPWSWLETTADFTVTPDVRSYDLPDNFDYGITMIDTNTDRNIMYVPAKEFFELTGNDTDTTAKAAELWTIFADKVYFHPVPSTQTTSAYTLYYYSEVSTLLAQDDPMFHSAFHWLLVEYCLWKLYNREEYFAQSERAFITYSRYVNEMIAFYNSKTKWSSFVWGDGRKPRPFTNIEALNI
jgi:hypothetical protein